MKEHLSLSQAQTPTQLGRLLRQYALPAVLSGLVGVLYNIIDQMFTQVQPHFCQIMTIRSCNRLAECFCEVIQGRAQSHSEHEQNWEHLNQQEHHQENQEESDCKASESFVLN